MTIKLRMTITVTQGGGNDANYYKDVKLRKTITITMTITMTITITITITMTITMTQGGGEAPKALSARVLVAAYWLFVVLNFTIINFIIIQTIIIINMINMKIDRC